MTTLMKRAREAKNGNMHALREIRCDEGKEEEEMKRSMSSYNRDEIEKTEHTLEGNVVIFICASLIARRGLYTRREANRK